MQHVPRRGDSPDAFTQCRWALMRNHAGVLLLSFSSKPLRAPRMPESHRMFEKLFFETIIPQARFKPPHHNRHYHGSWMSTCRSPRCRFQAPGAGARCAGVKPSTTRTESLRAAPSRRFSAKWS